MYLKLGNMSVEEFASAVNAEFTEEEVVQLKKVWSQKAELIGPDDFHIFRDPTITIHIGSVESNTVEIFKAANSRKSFDQQISFHLDNRWNKQ